MKFAEANLSPPAASCRASPKFRVPNSPYGPPLLSRSLQASRPPTPSPFSRREGLIRPAIWALRPAPAPGRLLLPRRTGGDALAATAARRRRRRRRRRAPPRAAAVGARRRRGLASVRGPRRPGGAREECPVARLVPSSACAARRQGGPARAQAQARAARRR